MVGVNPYNIVLILAFCNRNMPSASASVLDRAANALVVLRQAGYHHAVHQKGDHYQDERAGDDLGDDWIRVLLQRESLRRKEEQLNIYIYMRRL